MYLTHLRKCSAMPRSPHRWLRRVMPKACQELVQVEPQRETAKVLRQRDSPAAEVDPANNQVDRWGEHFPSLVGHRRDEPEQKIEDHTHHVTMQ